MARSAETGERQRFRFTRASVDRAVCPPGKQQAIYRDTDQPGLGLRVTAAGIKSFIYESKLGRQTIRMTIGPASMQIRAPRDKNGRPLAPAADDEAQRLARMVGQGVDPRLEKAGLIAEQAQQRADAKAARLRLELSGLQAWTAYCKERRPHWRGRSYVDHLAFVDAGGKERRRSKEKITKPGPLRALLARPLAEIDAAAVEQWVTNETRTRPARAALGFRLLRAFINWCAEHPEYRDIARADACKGRRTREKVGKSKAKNDALQREQLAAWFAEVRKLSPTLSAYLQCLLLTGARREELMALRWEDIDFRWGGMRLGDKVEDERTIPLTPYVAALLRDLKARNEKPPAPKKIRPGRPVVAQAKRKPSPWVFASHRAANGRIQDPNKAHTRAVRAAGLPHVTIHGLRRSFGTLSEWVEVPVGIVAQIQGHKPSAIAEKHYRVRPLDLLRLWHVRIETWILNEAGIEVPKVDVDGRVAPLRVVGGTDTR